MRWTVAAFVVGLGFLPDPAAADDPPLAEYFRLEVARIAARPLLGIDSAGGWKARRPELQAKLRGMLGLDPWPERTPLRAEVTGTVDRPDFVVEKILFQSSPGLYVTANLYRPKVVDRPLPAVLYVCGHSKVEKDGVILGCKVHYQHHPAWYASNGYVCLILDTLQLGELPGLHHGTSKFGMWWWSSRGYTPAGVEAWNAVRGIDYLISRPEVDAEKIGVTGRSGGGATSWWVGAIDDRVAAVVAVAGITDLKNHVVDGAVEGHCDCMYHVNTERWDFDTIAALVAPKPLLVENTDADSIFPEDGVRRIYARLETVYRWYGASDRLGLVIGKGGHADTVELRHPSFAFMDKWLKGIARPIVEPDRSIPEELLAVVASHHPTDGIRNGRPPSDNLNPIIHEQFRKPFESPAPPRTGDGWAHLRETWRERLRDRVFAGWPSDEEAGMLDLGAEPIAEMTRGNVHILRYSYRSQQGVRLPIWMLKAEGGVSRDVDRIVVLDQASWARSWGAILDESTNRPTGVGDGLPEWIEIRNHIMSKGPAIILTPRGVGPTAWPVERDKQTRRRFLLLGQTLDGMRVWDVVRGIGASRKLAPESRGIEYMGEGDAAAWLGMALAMRGGLPAGSVELTHPPNSLADMPPMINLDTILDFPRAMAMIHPRAVRLRKTSRDAWRWAMPIEHSLGSPGWLRID